MTRLEVARAFLSSNEARSVFVSQCYGRYLGRVPSAAEVQAWLAGQLDTAIEMQAEFLDSVEFWRRCSESPQEFVQRLYFDVLSRQPDPAGYAYWLSQLTALPPAATASPISGAGGGGAVWTQQFAQVLQTVAQGPAKVAFLGDSLTRRFAYENGAAVWNQSFRPLGCVDLGIDGLSTAEIIWFIQQGYVQAVKPKGVVIFIGTNNLGIYNQSPADVAEGIGIIVQTLRDQMPTLKVLVLGILPRGMSTDPLRTLLAAVNQQVGAMMQAMGATFADIGHNFVQGNGQLIPGLYVSDNLHMLEQGYVVERAAIWPWTHAVATS